MRFNIYGRFQLEVRREQERWMAYRLISGTRVPEDELVIPAELGEHELAVYLDDIFHELAGPGQSIEVVVGPAASAAPAVPALQRRN
ncbi:hypothetical protein [Massilia sp.]|uniref:DUF7661 family protein n=1 Tax=Massilia sp. TaxID=1882437 RepID=UPI002896DCFD|nr:hypothetical protein [Massilia sp.]